jgi:hypothetical protein
MRRAPPIGILGVKMADDDTQTFDLHDAKIIYGLHLPVTFFDSGIKKVSASV